VSGIGFTGTRQGLTALQHQTLHGLLGELVVQVEWATFHHGMCSGADEQASRIAHAYGYYVVGHPGAGKDGVAAYHGYSDKNEPPLPHMERNQVIVDEADIMLATPKDTSPPACLRGQGTWATIGRARRAGKVLHIVFPSGDYKVWRP
jgi:hypothetical protein